ncbi:MAG: OmpA family protein [Saprospiraceae bacterium]|nr:OmpA family protein [Saprospiraceae bacterium]
MNPFRHLMLLGLSGLLLMQACVSSKVYRAELSMREQCEAREKVLVLAELERRKETADLIKQVADFNRTIGNQEAQLQGLQNELNARTQQLGASSSKLATEVSDLQKELAGKNAQLTQSTNTVNSIAAAQKGRKKTLDDLKSTLAKNYATYNSVSVESSDNAVLLNLPDNGLFDKNGLLISPEGKTMLTALANLLANRPELDVEIRAYTDNALPKGTKNLEDTWDWSLQRATNLTRTLIREFNINANQLTPIGKGEFYPLSSNETAEGRLRNRRTVLAIFPKLQKVPAVE